MYDLGSTRESVEDCRIAYVGGGSRSWALVLMNDLAQCPDLSGEVALYDVDQESARRNARLGQLVQTRPASVGDWTYTAVEELGDALAGADIVVLSTRDPPEDTVVHDLDIPAEYGIVQTVGDTVGPGGALRAMRTVPQYREIAAAVVDHCPDAWVLNYTNPMSICTRTLYEAFPGIKAIGLCHEVAGTKDWLASLAERHLAATGGHVAPDRIDATVSGINHFTWLQDARWRDEALLPLVDRELDAGPVPAYDPGAMDGESYFVNNHQVTLDLYRRFDCLPAAGDRHLAEFVPWYLAVDSREAVHRWGIRCTPSEFRVDQWATGDERIDGHLVDGEPFELGDSGEELGDVIRALLGLEPLRTNVNLPNRGQAPDLERGAIVETNALLTRDDVTPLVAPELPTAVSDLIDTHVTNQELLVAAGMAGDVDRAFRAFRRDPLVTLPPDEAEALFAELVAAERDYLEAWDLAGAEVI